MIQGLISFIIGCGIILGITILATKQWYKYVDKKGIKHQPKSINKAEYNNIIRLPSGLGITAKELRRANVIHKYIDKQITNNEKS